MSDAVHEDNSAIQSYLVVAAVILPPAMGSMVVAFSAIFRIQLSIW